jgi:glyoxylase-like metal-dependent hydrolase (beta-lactamase superfamily II)
MQELDGGIRRVTFALPLGIDHVHCYLLPASGGGWTLVDTGLGLPDAGDRWAAALEEAGGSVERVVITHFHPDHIGAAADVVGLTGAPVFQGRVDYEQCLRVWGERRNVELMPDYLRAHGAPEAEVEAFVTESGGFARLVHFVADPEPLEPGAEVDGWEVLHLPGHADGHLALLRDGVLVAGDTLLGSITPNVGLWPESRPNPLDDYLRSLATIVELEPRLALPGHHEPLADPVGRAKELVAHHHERLEETIDALSDEPRTAYDVSLALFPDDLPPALRRFALTETRAHLEYLVAGEDVRRLDGDRPVTYALSG